MADYLQRVARHVASQTDVEQAYALGKSVVDFALTGKNNIMLTIDRYQDSPYQWGIGEVSLEKVANAETKNAFEFFNADGFHITEECRRYLLPLIQGESYPPYVRVASLSSITEKLCLQK